jgi:hypothetical protein
MARCGATLPKATRYRARMAETKPWISFHAPWVDRSKSGMVVFERIQRFLAACAVDPTPDWIEIEIDEHRRPDGSLPPLVDEATAAFGPESKLKTAGSSNPLASWLWERRSPAIADAPAMVEFYRAHESIPPLPGREYTKRAVQLVVNHWFEVKRPGATAPLFPGATLRSSVMIWLHSRRVNLSLRYQSPDFTPDLRAAHADILAALGPKTPRHALQRIIPARTPGGRERREPIT